jgi:hypothetical protein
MWQRGVNLNETLAGSAKVFSFTAARKTGTTAVGEGAVLCFQRKETSEDWDPARNGVGRRKSIPVHYYFTVRL